MAENVEEDKVTFDQMELDDRILKVCHQNSRKKNIGETFTHTVFRLGNSKFKLDNANDNSGEGHSTVS